MQADSTHTPPATSGEQQTFVMAPGRPLYVVSTALAALRPYSREMKVERILIYKLDHLGDLLIATPALRAIRNRFPGAEICIVVGEWNTPLLIGNPSVDRVLVYNSPRFTRPPYKPQPLRDVRRELGRWKPDLIIGLRDDWWSVMTSLVSGARRVERGRAHLSEWVERKRTRATFHHELSRLWETLRPLGIQPECGSRLDYYVSDGERRAARELLHSLGVHGPFALLHPGATQKLREWPMEHFAQLARHFARRWGMRIVLIGLDRERHRSRGVAEMIHDLSPLDLTGHLSLRPTAALMEQASIYVGSDGGAMHLAAATGIPTVGLFGPGSYDVFSPVGEKTVGVTRHFPCSPCQQVDCIRPNDTCMQAIMAAEVARIGDGLLERFGLNRVADSPFRAGGDGGSGVGELAEGDNRWV